MIILLTQLNSGQERMTLLINTSSTLWWAPVTGNCKNLHLWFVDGVVWPVVEVVTGHSAAGLGESLPLVDMLAVLLISTIITLGMYVTMKIIRQTGPFLVY